MGWYRESLKGYGSKAANGGPGQPRMARPVSRAVPRRGRRGSRRLVHSWDLECSPSLPRDTEGGTSGVWERQRLDDPAAQRRCTSEAGTRWLTARHYGVVPKIPKRARREGGKRRPSDISNGWTHVPSTPSSRLSFLFVLGTSEGRSAFRPRGSAGRSGQLDGFREGSEQDVHSGARGVSQAR